MPDFDTNLKSIPLPGVEIGSNAFIESSPSDGISQNLSPLADKAQALKYTHPDYDSNILQWEKYTDCYEAKNMIQYLFKHSRESDDLYKQRVKRGYYFNYVASVVDLFVSYLFHAPIQRDEGSLKGDDLEDFYKDADQAGTTFHLLIQNIATHAQICGHVGVLVDMPALAEAPESEAERKEQRIRPYCTIFKANQILDWELDTNGKFEWVKLEMCFPQERTWDSPVDSTTRHFLIWSKTQWQHWKVYRAAGDDEDSLERAELISEGPNPLGEVPFVICRNEKCLSHPWMGLSAVRDITDINIGIYNWSSLADEEIYERCINILVMEEDGDSKPVTLGHHNILTFQSGTQHPPFYLEPGENPLDLIGKWIERGKDEIFRLAKMGGLSGIKGSREATSGIAYAFEFNETNQALARKAESLQQMEIEIHRLAAKWLRKEWDGSITYPKEFGVDDFLTEFQILSEARQGLTSETAIKQIESRLTSKIFAREKQELRDKIRQEIDSADPRGPGMLESFGKMPASLYGGSGKND